MPIPFACGTCKRKYMLADNLAGQSIRCKCGAMVALPREKQGLKGLPPLAVRLLFGVGALLLTLALFALAYWLNRSR